MPPSTRRANRFAAGVQRSASPLSHGVDDIQELGKGSGADRVAPFGGGPRPSGVVLGQVYTLPCLFPSGRETLE